MDTLARLEQTIKARLAASPEESYVARLGAGGAKVIGKKVAEEAAELVIEGVAGDEVDVTGEAADLLFHTMVLLAHRGVSLATVLAELERREGTSGLAEKAARGA